MEKVRIKFLENVSIKDEPENSFQNGEVAILRIDSAYRWINRGKAVEVGSNVKSNIVKPEETTKEPPPEPEPLEYSAAHKGRGNWTVSCSDGSIVAEGLKKAEAKAKVKELNG